MMNRQMVQQIFGAVQNGANPQMVVMQLAQNNPVFKNAMNMANGRTPAQIYDMAFQMAQRRGVDINQLAQQLGIELPRY